MQRLSRLAKRINKKYKYLSKKLQKKLSIKAKRLRNILEKGFFELAKRTRKINYYFIVTVLIVNSSVFTTSSLAFNSEKAPINGDSQKLSKIVLAIAPFTPNLDEKIDHISEENNYTFLDKPEIIETKTREQLDQEKAEKEKQEKILAQKQRTVVARERASAQTEDITSETVTTKETAAPRQGNGYFYGFCTWYVANKRIDVPNNWGNAKSWLSSAQQSGWSTGSTPEVGAIVVTSESWAGHVGYVEKVEEDTFVISEMNYKGWGKTSTRTIDKNNHIIRGFIY